MTCSSVCILRQPQSRWSTKPYSMYSGVTTASASQMGSPYQLLIIWAAFSIETFANVLQNILSIVQDCCGTFAHCFDIERSHGYGLPTSFFLPATKNGSTRMKETWHHVNWAGIIV